jgi:putative ABC transport system ATP-binding protein
MSGRGGVAAELVGVTKTVNATSILDGVSLSVRTGEVVLIRGASGSGKSSALRLLAGIDSPDEGTVRLLGVDLAGVVPRARSKLIRDRVGIGFQDPLLDNALPVIENLYGLARVNGRFSEHRRADRERLAWLADTLRVAHKLHGLTAVLSGGEKLRLALGRALMARPDIVLLDEPTHMVDSAGKKALYESLAAIVAAEAVTVIVVSHDDEARGFAHREIIFDRGRAFPA